MSSFEQASSVKKSPFRPVGVARPYRVHSTSPADSGFGSVCSSPPRISNQQQHSRQPLSSPNSNPNSRPSRRSRSVSRAPPAPRFQRTHSVPSVPSKIVPSLALAPSDWIRHRQTPCKVWQHNDDGGFLSVGSGVVPFDRHRTTLDGLTLDTDDLGRVLSCEDELVLTDAKLSQSEQGRQVELEFAMNIKYKHSAKQEHPWVTHGLIRDIDDGGATILVKELKSRKVVYITARVKAFNNNKGRTITDFFEGQSVLCRATYNKTKWSAVIVAPLQPIMHWNECNTTLLVVQQCRSLSFIGVTNRYVYIPSLALKRSQVDLSQVIKGAKFRATVVPNVMNAQLQRTRSGKICPLRAVQLFPLYLDSTPIPQPDTNNNTLSNNDSIDLIQL